MDHEGSAPARSALSGAVLDTPAEQGRPPSPVGAKGARGSVTKFAVQDLVQETVDGDGVEFDVW